MKSTDVEEKTVGTQTLGGRPGCVRVISNDPPVNLEVILLVKRWKQRRLWSSPLPEVTEQNPGVRDYSAHVLGDIKPLQVFSACVSFSCEDPFNM